MAIVPIQSIRFAAFLILSFFVAIVNAAEPRLNFTDIDSGPSTGLGDGLGSGSIVTLWGNNLGSQQGESKVMFRASNGDVNEVAHVYYWKNADGSLPGGPADLYTSHRMQEIAVSIPSSANGVGELYVVVGGVESNKLDFTVRPGAFKFVAYGGDNKASCSFNDPCGWINGDIRGNANGIGNQKLVKGDIVYSRGVIEPDYCGGGVCAGLFLRSAMGTKDEPISIAAYPGTRPQIISSNRGVNPYASDYINISKFHISVGSKDPSTPPDPGSSAASDVHIQASKGRYVGNYMDEKQGTCFNGWSGSITAGGAGGDSVKIFGNHFYDLGCDNTSRFQHTLYLSVRNSNVSNVNAWDVGWNNLEDNKSLFGIHSYDETFSGDCGQLVGTLSVHDNYIINQKGAGINIGTTDRGGEKNYCWEADVEVFNNLLINVGLGPAGEEKVTNAGAIRIGGDMGSQKVSVYNNTIYGYSDEGSRLFDAPKAIEINYFLTTPNISVVNNLVYSFGDYDFLKTNVSISEQKNNLYYTTADSPKFAIAPLAGQNLIVDPQCSVNISTVNCSQSSSVIDAALLKAEYDIYGNYRGSKPDIGAIEYDNGGAVLKSKPLPPVLVVE